MAHIHKMDKEFWIAIYIAAVGVVPLAAGALGYAAHYNFGLSRQEIRTEAMIAALVVAVLMLVIELFCQQWRKLR